MPRKIPTLRLLVFIVAFSVLAQPSFAADRSKAVGIWKLVSYEVEIQATGQKEPVMGEHPTGYVALPRSNFTASVSHQKSKA
jgi:hypothetical protein